MKTRCTIKNEEATKSKEGSTRTNEKRIKKKGGTRIKIQVMRTDMEDTKKK